MRVKIYREREKEEGKGGQVGRGGKREESHWECKGANKDWECATGMGGEWAVRSTKKEKKLKYGGVMRGSQELQFQNADETKDLFRAKGPTRTEGLRDHANRGYRRLQVMQCISYNLFILHHLPYPEIYRVATHSIKP